jgi:Dolichyl-phosphate-mannose-protein mannosyltransferase
LRSFQTIINRLWDKLLVFCGVLFVLIPTSPWNMPLTYKDSGVFLYIGWRILHGEVPYRDVWDHKPPVIFYINALGELITKNSRWGVWIIEFICLFVAAYIGFRLVKRLLDPFAAVFSLFLWLLTLEFLIEGGNLTTEYTLPLQFAAFWLIFDSDKPDFPFRRWFLVGLIGGIAFFTKQTTIGVWIAIAVYLTIQRLKSGQAKRWIKEILFLSAGGLTICIITVMFFAYQGALAQFWSAAFIFNLAYSSSATGLVERLQPIIGGLGDLARVGLFQFSMVGYIIGAFVIFRKNILREGLPLVAVALIDLPLEWILISISGKVFSHYYMAILPVLSLFAGFTFWALISWLSSWGITNITKSFFLICVMGVFVWGTVDSYRKQVVEFHRARSEDQINYIKSISVPEDNVLIWGEDSAINYFTRRKSPTRFVYQTPLYEKGYVDEAMVLGFLDDIIKNRPHIIIDTKDPATPMYNFPINSDAIKASIEYLKSHYRVLKDSGGWTVYEYTESESSP